MEEMIWLICFAAGTLCFNFIYCYGADSSEANRGENAAIPPFYDTIVFNDIADIINELENPKLNGNSLIEAFVNSVESQSDENIEDLLLEYQHYLDKARKQRKMYFDKTKQLKNKVPALRSDSYIKKKTPLTNNYDSIYFANNVYNPNEVKYAQSYYNPIDVLIPLDSRSRFFIDAPATVQTKVDSKYDDNMYTFQKSLSKQRVIDSPPHYHHLPPKEPNMSSCYCKTNVIPCECDCAQCIVPPDMTIRNQNENRNKYHEDRESTEIFNIDNNHDASDDTFNIKIKVDIQLPKTQDIGAPKHKNRHPTRRADTSKEMPSTSVNVPFQYLNFPVPMQIFGLNKGSKNNRAENPQSHKLLIHKKKKSRAGPNNKKHRKKIITFHNVKPDLRPKIIPIFEEKSNITDDQNSKGNESIVSVRKLTNITESNDQSIISSNSTNNITSITDVPNIVNETQTEENINLNVKLMVLSENTTENSSRFENNIDLGLEDIEIEKKKSNRSDISENIPGTRRKRKVSQVDEAMEHDVKSQKSSKTHENKKSSNLQKSKRLHIIPNKKSANVKSSNFRNDKIRKHTNSTKKQEHVNKTPNKNKSGSKTKKDGVRHGVRKSGKSENNSHKPKTKTKTRRFAKSHDIKQTPNTEREKSKGDKSRKPDHKKYDKSSSHFKGATKAQNQETPPQHHNTKRSKPNNVLDNKLLGHNVSGIQSSGQKNTKHETNIKTQTKKPFVMKRASSLKAKAVLKPEKNLFLDAQLLYWPSQDKNLIALGGVKKNITSLILEREQQKSKVNISVEVIRQNHTKALEKAVFGDVDWDDVDTIAPIFMSFVGKYIRGVLTMCSQTVCHSMNCGNKVCIHRVCIAKDRLNNGHCIGNNGTESDVSLESIMDLPSNIAFTVVDILHDKMLGKLFGKLTLCISSKCVTFAAAKKNFVETKCSTKNLSFGHCSNVKKA